MIDVNGLFSTAHFLVLLSSNNLWAQRTVRNFVSYCPPARIGVLMVLRDLKLSRDMLIIFRIMQTLNIHWAMVTHDVNDWSLVEV